MTDVEQAKRVIKTTAQLSLKLVEDVGAHRGGAAPEPRGQGAATTWRSCRAQGDEPGQPVFYLVRREAVITGRDLKNARAGVDAEQRSPTCSSR